ncbi:MAG TPA: phosphoribosylanthranilate isomerase [Bacteroidaceae bacterium]|nr:phosphoribosylanthranilate isomerase [Bacteroidaceae bacterium]
MIIKVCGMREAQNIHDIEQLAIDWMGFIFYEKSPRYCNDALTYMPRQVERVGVFVNHSLSEILKLILKYKLDIVQLHGQETPALCKQLQQLGIRVIKAMPIATKEDLVLATAYEDVIDYMLFDTKSELGGGSGKQFDWSILNDYSLKIPFLISGGIGPQSLDSLRDFTHPQLIGYDLNSKFEISPGMKSLDLLAPFINELRRTN